MKDIQSRSVSSMEYWWTCPYCGWWTGRWGGAGHVNYLKEDHEKLCARARALGLEPIFRNSDPVMFGTNRRIQSWKRTSDGAEMNVHGGIRRSRYVPHISLDDALEEGWTKEEYEAGKATKREEYLVGEVHFFLDGNWQEPFEVYEVCDYYDWTKHDAEIPWLKEETNGQT